VANKQHGGDRHRQTKAERKEDARVERERIQRQMSSRKRNRNIGVALVAIAAIAILIVVVITQGGTASGPLPTADELLAKAPAATTAAGCTDVQETPNYENAPGDDPDIDHVHIGAASSVQTPPALSTYPTVPPASGPHDPTPLSAGVYDTPPNIYATIHSLEHAAVVIWYDPSVADSSAVQQIKDFYKQSDDVGQSKVIVAPYGYPDQGAQGSLPANTKMALVAWHRLRTCAEPSLAVAFDFSSQYANTYPARPYIGVAREPTASLP
jgi:hypothetical protein